VNSNYDLRLGKANRRFQTWEKNLIGEGNTVREGRHLKIGGEAIILQGKNREGTDQRRGFGHQEGPFQRNKHFNKSACLQAKEKGEEVKKGKGKGRFGENLGGLQRKASHSQRTRSGEGGGGGETIAASFKVSWEGGQTPREKNCVKRNDAQKK